MIARLLPLEEGELSWKSGRESPEDTQADPEAQPSQSHFFEPTLSGDAAIGQVHFYGCVISRTQ